MSGNDTGGNHSYAYASDSDTYIIKDHQCVTVLLALGYSTVFVVSVLGNSLVVYVVCVARDMQTVTNLLIANLACSDLVVTLSSLWLTAAYTILNRWVWGTFACYIFSTMQGASIYISTFTLTAIAVDRFVVMVAPLRPRMRVRTCLFVIALIWVMALGIILPYVINHMGVIDFHFPDGENVSTCDEIYFNTSYVGFSRQTLGFIFLSSQFGLPFLIISACYLGIYLSMRLRDTSLLLNSASTQRQTSERRRKNRMNRMLILMVVIFAICWLPINLMNFTRDIGVQMIPQALWRYYSVIFLLFHLTAMTTTCWNPLLYSWLNENFRSQFALRIPCLRPLLSPRISISNGTFTTRFRGKSCRQSMSRAASAKPSATQQSPAKQALLSSEINEMIITELSTIKHIEHDHNQT